VIKVLLISQVLELILELELIIWPAIDIEFYIKENIYMTFLNNNFTCINNLKDGSNGCECHGFFYAWF
jgi:hypothetical protein